MFITINVEEAPNGVRGSMSYVRSLLGSPSALFVSFNDDLEFDYSL